MSDRDEGAVQRDENERRARIFVVETTGCSDQRLLDAKKNPFGLTSSSRMMFSDGFFSRACWIFLLSRCRGIFYRCTLFRRKAKSLSIIQRVLCDASSLFAMSLRRGTTHWENLFPLNSLSRVVVETRILLMYSLSVFVKLFFFSLFGTNAQ